MSRRRVTRARASLPNFYCESDSNSGGEDWLQLFSEVSEGSSSSKCRRQSKTSKATFPNKRSSRGAKKSISPKKKNALTQKKKSSSSTSVSLEIDNEHVDNKQIKNKIECKVADFFKSGHLLSDDEAEDNIDTNPKVEIKQPLKESKEFYLLSDSDDDKPSTSVKDTPVVIKKSNCAIKPKDDELMHLVDEILENNIPDEVNVEPDQSWNEYKSKTNEILESVSAILNDVSKDAKEPEQKKTAIKSPEKEKLSCPICLETFGEGVPAATTICGHIFCQLCIQQVAKTTKKCPTCRKLVNNRKIHAIYL